MSEKAAKIVLRNTGWLQNQPDWLTDSILDCARLRTYKAGEFTYLINDEPGGMYGVVDGGFGVLVPSGGSGLVLCHVVRSGTWFGTGPVLTKSRRTLSFKAVETSRVLHVTLSDLNVIGARHPELFGKIGELSESSFYAIAVRVIGDLLIGSGERRIASVIARIGSPETAGLPKTLPRIHLSQTEIGQMCNCSRDRVNKALQKFAKAGWVSINYKAVTVNDVAALEEFATNEAHESARSAAADL